MAELAGAGPLFAAPGTAEPPETIALDLLYIHDLLKAVSFNLRKTLETAIKKNPEVGDKTDYIPDRNRITA